jgi:prolyl oligopeptidase
MKQLLLYLFLSTSLFAQINAPYPLTKKTKSELSIFGKTIPDPYDWLEENSEEVTDWVSKQNAHTYNYLKETPLRLNIQERIMKNTLNSYYVPTRYGSYFIVPHIDHEVNSFDFYYTDNLITGQWEELYVTKGMKQREDEVLHLDEFSVSGDSRYIAFMFNRNGSDWKEIRVVDIKTGKTLNDHLKDVRFSNISWRGNGFFYCRYDSINEETRYLEKVKNQRLYYHKLGTDEASDSLVLRKHDSPYGYYNTAVSKDERFLIIEDHDQADGISTYYYFDYNETVMRGMKPIVCKVKYGLSFMDNDGDLMIFESGKAETAKVVGIDAKSPQKWIEMIPKLSDAIFESAEFHKGQFYVIATQEAEEKLIVFDTKGNVKKVVAFPFGTHYSFRGEDLENNKLYFTYTSFLHPPVLLNMDMTTYKFDVVNQTKVYYEFQDYEIQKLWYQSDTAKVPLLLMCKKGMKFDGNSPVLLEVYGGFGISCEPNFDPGRIMFIENGGIYVFAMIRGGGELGLGWEYAGKNLNKKNSISDIIHAAEFLIENKYTSKEKIAVTGGSQGGLMAAAVAIKRPDLFKVSIPVVGLHDLMKYEKYTSGPLFVREYGSIKDSMEFLNLLSYSPLHNIKKGQKYPAMLIMTSAYDDRVPPLHSYKLTAALQGIHSPNTLLRVERGSGHNGAATYDKNISEQVDFYSFLFHNLGIQKLNK